MTEITDILRANGPQTVGELPRTPNVEDRIDGAATFKLNVKSISGDISKPRTLSSVVYLFDEHSDVQVASVFWRENRNALSEYHHGGLMSAISTAAGKSWVPAFREAIDDDWWSE